jgi:OFA family oxalate/formate antiporter-like MFS transporter
VVVPSASISIPRLRVANRWIQLFAGVVATAAMSNLQYAWILFTKPLTETLHTSLVVVQVAFSTFILAGTWLVPLEGYLIDRLGPRRMLSIAGVLVGSCWIGAGTATTVRELIFWYTLGGVGVGVVATGTVGNALKWFPDHRGLCVGLTAAAYGGGTALTIAPIARMIDRSGYAHTLVTWGTAQGILVILAALVLVKPPVGWKPSGWKEKETPVKSAARISGMEMTPVQMLRTGSFWVIYVMMTMIAFGGLVVTAQLSPIARFYGVDKVIVAFGMSALVLAVQLDQVLNGLSRPFWGWVSDHIGRENTMFIAFSLEALSVFGLLHLVHRPMWFIFLSGLCFFAWGEIFSLFPSITGDLFGKTWATTNYGLVYTAKGLASIFAGPVAALASVRKSSWVPVFWAMIACDMLAAFMALFWLKPAAARTIAHAERMRHVAEAAARAKSGGMHDVV